VVASSYIRNAETKKAEARTPDPVGVPTAGASGVPDAGVD
jgi:hypothetical protein